MRFVVQGVCTFAGPGCKRYIVAPEGSGDTLREALIVFLALLIDKVEGKGSQTPAFAKTLSLQAFEVRVWEF